MERLLAIFFSVTLLIATASPGEPVGECSGADEVCLQKPGAESEGSCLFDFGGCNDSDKSACPIPVCCISSSCCCLCIVPERPELPEPVWLPETRTQPATQRGFTPQQVWLSVWKPPAFSV